MNSRLSVSVLLTLGLCSCVASTGGPGAGAGGTTGSGGKSIATGGTGSGGNTSSGSGGNTGSGGGGNTGSGGARTGGSTGSGGNAVGSGGAGTGGRGTGGAAATGGAGGRGTGGTGTSGAGTGGVGGASGWIPGYTATVFGNTAASPASDCSGVPNFTDSTLISRATCTSQGFPVATYTAGVANAASFYGAPGDLSSIWVGPLCTCPAGQATCVPSCRMEGDCGRCFEVKCDPAGTGSYSDGATRAGAMYCNPNQSAVVQIIDACPHNHSNNTWWCTAASASNLPAQNHIDISCSAMKAIAGNPAMIGNWGWLNVQVRQVDCAVGLGAKSPIAP